MRFVFLAAAVLAAQFVTAAPAAAAGCDQPLSFFGTRIVPAPGGAYVYPPAAPAAAYYLAPAQVPPPSRAYFVPAADVGGACAPAAGFSYGYAPGATIILRDVPRVGYSPAGAVPFRQAGVSGYVPPSHLPRGQEFVFPARSPVGVGIGYGQAGAVPVFQARPARGTTTTRSVTRTTFR